MESIKLRKCVSKNAGKIFNLIDFKIRVEIDGAGFVM
jgi:hypothetical protein